MATKNYKAVVIGGSAGSMEMLLLLFSFLPEQFSLPIIVVTHLHPEDDGGLAGFLEKQTGQKVREARDKEHIQGGCIFLPSAGYHLLVENDMTFSLSVDPKVNFSRPSIDVLFESAALAFGEGLVGILLTGASSDGAAGICAINKYGGFTIAQDPEEAACGVMPQAAIATGKIDRVLLSNEIGKVLQKIVGRTADNSRGEVHEK